MLLSLEHGSAIRASGLGKGVLGLGQRVNECRAWNSGSVVQCCIGEVGS